MGSTRIEDLTQDTQERVKMLIQLAGAEGIGIHPISTRRTCADQAAIYAQGRTAPGAIVSGAAGCRTWHVWGRAIDLLAVRNGKIVNNANDPIYDRLGELGESLGMVWGGKFSWGRDAGHFEYHPGVKISDVCPDPSQCEWALKQGWPVGVEPPANPPPTPTDEPPDVIYEPPPDPVPGSSIAMKLLAGAAVIGAGYMVFKAYKAYQGAGT